MNQNSNTERTMKTICSMQYVSLNQSATYQSLRASDVDMPRDPCKKLYKETHE